MAQYNGWMGEYHVPDISKSLSTMVEASDEFRAKRENKAVGEAATTGKLSDAANIAFKQGNVKTGLALQDMDDEKRTKIAGVIGQAALNADTPEKWSKLQASIQKRFPGEEIEPFEAREGIVAMHRDYYKERDDARADRADARAGATHSAAMSAAANKAPDIESFYDDATGQEYKAQWNPTSRSYERVGGVKTAEPKAPDIQTFFDEKTGLEYKAQWDPKTRAYNRVGGVKAPNKTKLNVGADGAVSFEDGPSTLGTSTTNETQKKALNAAEVGSRINSILENFDPKDQTLGSRFNAARMSGQAKLDPNSLSPGEKQQLTGFQSRKSTALSNLNRTLNELSGAAVSPTEEDRLKGEMPNPGTGIFDGDDPVTFEAKAKAVAENMERALARYNYYLKSGVPKNMEEVPLNNVRKVNGEWYVLKAGKVFKVGDPNTPAQVK